MADDKKVFDVAAPGKTTADPTSRPIIMGHGTRIKNDPMVNNGESSDRPATSSEAKGVRDKVIAPLHEEPPVEEAPKEEAASEDVPKEEVAEPEVQESTSSDSAVVDAVVEQAKTSKKAEAVDENGLTEEEKARRQHVDSLVEDKKYFLPIGKVTRKKQAQDTLVAIVLVIILLAAGGYYAYTQGYLSNLR